mgnify:CR=1 FL=1
MSQTAIEFQNVTKQFDNAALPSVDQVSLTIEEGEFITILGSSGSGKTTLLKMVNRLYEPTGGKIFLFGEDISTVDVVKVRRRIGYVIQQIGLFPHMTIADNISVVPKLLNWDKKQTDERVDELLNLVGLDLYCLSRYPHELSGGQKQRIGIARALALEPDIIICDEAVSALDVSVQAQVLNLLQELKEKLGLTYFFISHNLNVVYQVSDRVGVMYLGNMVEIADYDKLYEKRYHPYTEALLSAIPQVDQGVKTERIHLEGEVPSPSDPPSGCRFHTRCPKACDRCRQEVPRLKEVAEGHFVACHLY